MRVVAWLFVACATLCALSVFITAVKFEIGGGRLSKRTELSLYQASEQRALVGRLLAGYRASKHREVGGDLLRKAAPRLGGKARAALADVRDAMDTLDDVSDEDIRAAGIALKVAVWTVVGLESLAILLVFVPLMRGSQRRGPRVGALLASLVGAAIGVGLHVAARIAIAEANDEAGARLFSLGAGAYLLPITALLGLVLAIALVAQRRPAAAG